MAEKKWEVAFEGLSQYRTPLSFELAKKKLNFVFDDGKMMLVDFIDGEMLSYTMDGVTGIHKYMCMKADETLFMVMVDKKGSPREGFILVFDTATRLVTGNFVKQGTPDHPKKMVENIRFGYIDIPGKKAPEARHAFTEDLVGKRIQWTYNPNFKITHNYKSKNEVYWTIDDPEMKARMEAARGDQPAPEMKPEYCFQIKLSDYMYIFSWIEAISGTEGFLVINADRVHDVGCFFGCNPEGEEEAYCFAAYGKVLDGEV